MRSRSVKILRAACLAALSFALIGIAGCGSGGKYRVRGKLEYEDGTALTDLAGFTITFTSEKLGRSSRAEIQPDATFELSTNQENDGAYPGEYKVTVSQPHVEPGRPEKRHPVVELIYEDPEATTLSATVEANHDNNFTFKLARIKTPAR